MFRNIAIITAAAAAMSMAAATAQSRQSDATDFSSATNKPAVQKQAPHGPKPSGGAPKNFGGNKNFGPPKSAGGNKNFNANKNTGGNKNFGGNKNLGNVNKQNFKGNPNLGSNPANLGVKNLGGKNLGGQNLGGKNLGLKNNAVKFQPGPGKINNIALKPAANVQFVKLGLKSAPMWKSGPKKMWWGNKWKVFVPLTALGVVALGGAYYYPDAYLTVARPYCEGITPDGCRLNWQRIDFEDGESDWQCVQYCRRPGLPPPPRTVAFVAPPPLPQGRACELAIFSEPGFGGINATANDEQPHLEAIGWDKQIASVRVAAGTWDFFSDPEFTGETMRLQPGEYPDLGAEWAKRAGSFMCVQP